MRAELAAFLAVMATAASAPRLRPGPRDALYWLERGREEVMRAREWATSSDRAKGIVLFVGDGMGLSTQVIDKQTPIDVNNLLLVRCENIKRPKDQFIR